MSAKIKKGCSAVTWLLDFCLLPRWIKIQDHVFLIYSLFLAPDGVLGTKKGFSKYLLNG